MSGTKIILDTNIIGAALSDEQFFKKNFKTTVIIGISIITKFEFLANKGLSVKDRFLFEEYVDSINVYELTKADLTLHNHIVSIRKKYNLKLPDSIIAATALSNNATLISSDDVFSKIFNLKFQYIKM
jgi:predicted nucleic acid-binding protein